MMSRLIHRGRAWPLGSTTGAFACLTRFIFANRLRERRVLMDNDATLRPHVLSLLETRGDSRHVANMLRSSPRMGKLQKRCALNVLLLETRPNE